MVRGKDNVIRAFYNACRHRGGPLVKTPCGKVDGLVCGYHGWTYSLDGTLVNLRDKRDFPGLDMTSRALVGVRCRRVSNWGFFHAVGHADPLLHRTHQCFASF